jgi:all-trans-retinol dehydrogenase (NAD+)
LHALASPCAIAFERRFPPTSPICVDRALRPFYRTHLESPLPREVDVSEIKGRTALVTGGASGMGKLLALRLAEAGAKVVVWDIDERALDGVVAELTAAGSADARGYACNVGDYDAVAATASRTLADVGPVDILVNNAGVVSGASLLDLTPAQIERTFRVNTLSLFWTTKAFLPEMIRNGRGHIVNLASASGYIGVAKLADYSASKWAAIGFDESLRAELAKSAPAIRTTVVCPYYVDTGMFHGVRSRFSFLLPILKPEAVVRKIIRAIERDKVRVVMPPLVYLVPAMRLLPVRMMDGLAGALGVNVSMDHFSGRGEGP